MSTAWNALARCTLVLLLICIGHAAALAAQPAVALTPEQARWVDRHGKVRLGLSRSEWPPFDIVSPAGQHSGITADYLKLLQERTGIRVEVVLFDDWDQAMRATRTGKVDLLGSISRTPEREKILAFTGPYVSNPSVIIVRKDERDISGMDSLHGKTVAVEGGFAAAEVLRTRYPEIRLKTVRTTSDALLDVSLGRADAYVGDLIVSTWLIDHNYLTNLEVRDAARVSEGDLRFAVRKDLPQLRGVLDAGLASLTEGDHRTIRQRWVPVAERSTPSPQAIRIELSEAERRWIAAHPRIRVGVDPAWEPLDFIDGSGLHSGLAADYLQLMRERLGLNLEAIPGADWSETFERARRREVDMIALITPTAERSREFLFTSPYAAIPMVIVTRTDARFVSDLHSLDGETVAVMRGYFVSDYLAANYPKIVQLPVNAAAESLETVNRGYAYATIGSLATLGPRIQKDYLGRLKIAGKADFLQELAMGVRTDWPELAALLDKGLASMTDQEQQALRQKWLAFRVEYGVDWRELAKVAAPIVLAVLVVIAVIVVANRRLKRQIAETERKDMELKVQLAFQRALMDTIPSPILFKDSDARIYGCNRAFEDAFGTAREEMLGCTVEEAGLFLPDQARRMFEEDLNLLKEPDRMLHNELRLRFADGLDHVVLYWKTAFRLIDGSVGGLLAVIVDITQLKQLEQAAHEARNAADAANRAKSSFLATMSHEIRTPMNAVLGMLELLGLTRLDDDQARSVDIVRDSAKSLLRIIDDILDFSKIEAGKLEIKPEATSVDAVVESVYLVYTGVASAKKLLLKKNLDARISPALQADPLRLRQILNNFVSNALKFTEAGEVEMRVRFIERRDGREFLEFSVRDTGIGISPENQARLFQPFMQAEADTTRRFGGTGLGLTICLRLAQLMGGQISMQSEPGRGTTMMFTAGFAIADPVELKKADNALETGMQRALAARRQAPGIEQAAAEGRLVLLADDHPTNRLLLVRQLNTLGYAAETAEDGAAALEKWTTGRYAVLITDCHMPVMDGYELARTIRGREAADGGRRTPIIACTANALQGEAEACYAAGMDDFIPKPVEMRALLSKLERWLPLPQGSESGRVAEAAEPDSRGESPVEPGPLAEISGGNKALEREILQDYRKSNDADARMLDEAFAKRDAEGVRQVAHRMKGAGRMVGARDLALLCESMEQGGRERQWDELLAIKPRVDEELQRLNRFLAML
ncbi:MAG TPA: transporter substrate-binding domain-containing protein [Burkholderiales bacterium]